MAHRLMIGDLAMYGSCKVRINSAKLRGIAAPHYRFSCTDYSHEPHTGWGDLTSYELLRPIARTTAPHSDLPTIDLSHDLGTRDLTGPFGEEEL